MNEDYGPGRIAAMLDGEACEPEEAFDLQLAVQQLEPLEQAYVVALTQGYTIGEAYQQSGLSLANPSRENQRILHRLTILMNGER